MCQSNIQQKLYNTAFVKTISVVAKLQNVSRFYKREDFVGKLHDS